MLFQDKTENEIKKFKHIGKGDTEPLTHCSLFLAF